MVPQRRFRVSATAAGWLRLSQTSTPLKTLVPAFVFNCSHKSLVNVIAVCAVTLETAPDSVLVAARKIGGAKSGVSEIEIGGEAGIARNRVTASLGSHEASSNSPVVARNVILVSGEYMEA